MSPMSSSSVFGAIAFMVILATVVALVAGLSLASNDVFNPNTSSAAALEKKLAAEGKAAKDAVDLDAYRAQKAAEVEKKNFDLANYKTVEAAKVQAEMDKIRLEVITQQSKSEQDLTFAQQINAAWTTGIQWALKILSVGVAACLGLLGYSRLVLAQAQATQSDPWHNPVFRVAARNQARKNEQARHEAVLAWQAAAQKSTISGNGKKPPKQEPIKAMQG